MTLRRELVFPHREPRVRIRLPPLSKKLENANVTRWSRPREEQAWPLTYVQPLSQAGVMAVQQRLKQSSGFTEGA